MERTQEISPLAPDGTICTCGSGVACTIEQHFFARNHPFEIGGTNLVIGQTQGMKTRQGLMAGVVAFRELGLVPIIFARNISADRMSWVDSMAPNNFKTADGFFLDHRTSATGVINALTGGGKNIPTLVCLYNSTGIENARLLMEELPNRVHVIFDEADLIVQSEGGRAAMERRAKNVLKDAALVTWITATPMALTMANDIRERDTSKFHIFQIDIAPQYYRFRGQIPGDAYAPDTRIIGFKTCANISHFFHDVLSESRVRRILLVSPQTAMICNQISRVKAVIDTYNHGNNTQKTVVAMAWRASGISFEFAGKLANVYRNAVRARVGAGLSVKEELLFFKPVAANSLTALQQIYDHLIGAFEEIHNHHVRADETTGPDIVVVAGAMVNRGVRLESGSHGWILTDMHVETAKSWSLEQAIQTIGRLNGTSMLNVTKTLWGDVATIRWIRATLSVSAHVLSRLSNDQGRYTSVMDIHQAIQEHIDACIKCNRTTDMSVIDRDAFALYLRRTGMSRTAVVKRLASDTHEFMDEAVTTLKKRKIDPNVITVVDRPDTLEGPTVAAAGGLGSLVPLGRRGSSKLDYAAVWKKPEMENAFRALGVGTFTKNIVASHLVERHLAPNRCQANKLLDFGKKNAGAALVEWVRPNHAAGVLVSCPRMWNVHGVGDASASASASTSAGAAASVREQLELMFEVGQIFTLDDLKKLEVWTKIEARHRSHIHSLVRDGFLEHVSKATYRRLV
jgi:hypothetical protein